MNAPGDDRPCNLAVDLDRTAAEHPDRRALVAPAGYDRTGRARFTQWTFRQLADDVAATARGLADAGLARGERVILLVRPGPDLLAVTFALLRLGAVPVFIDPGMGRRAFRQCVQEAAPTTLIGIPPAHLLPVLHPAAFRSVRRRLVTGRRPLPGAAALDRLRRPGPGDAPHGSTTAGDEAAVAFTSGSTGIPKGVVFRHGTFAAVIDLMRDAIGISPGEIDLPGLYIFALFNPALGVTTVLPDMNPMKPAAFDPGRLVEAIRTHGVTTSFGSPTIWKKMAAHCLERGIRLPSLRRVLMAGAPVPPGLIERMHQVLTDGEVFTPFGATEALPVTNIGGREILAEAADPTRGVCVGRPMPGLTVRVIEPVDGLLGAWAEARELPPGVVGEIVVKGPVVTREYLNRPRQTAEAKIPDGDAVWHRMGDLGYWDEAGRLWFCGRRGHRVDTAAGPLLPIPVEAVFNTHPDVARTALVGVGPRGRQTPVLVVETRPERRPRGRAARERLAGELRNLGAVHPHTREITDIRFHPAFPMDVRHNAKIRRELLAEWAAGRNR